MSRSRRFDYCELRQLLQLALREHFDVCSVEVDGKLRRIPEGMWHDNFYFRIRGKGLTAMQTDRSYFLRLLQQRHDWQQGPEPRERLLRESKTLKALEQCNFPQRTPEFLCLLDYEPTDSMGMVETSVSGHSLAPFKNASTMQTVARVAADVHRLDIDRFPHLQRNDSRSEHVRNLLREIDEALFTEYPLAHDVHQWISEREFSEESICVLHGDLLPQNILSDHVYDQDIEAPVSVVDWEMAKVGDPAYDLAIVTRGNRKVLGLRNGINKLVSEYLAAGGQAITAIDVRVHELILVLYWLEEAWREYQKLVASGQGPDFYYDQLRSLFKRVCA